MERLAQFQLNINIFINFATILNINDDIMKKIISTLLFVSIALFANAYDFMVDGLCYNINSDNASVTVTFQNTSPPRYSNLSGDIVIPTNVTYNGTTYSVMTIGGGAFYGCSDLISMNIPNSVTSIGSSAFRGCSGLTSLTIPNSVTSIGGYAFDDCSGLTSITIPNSVTEISFNTFSGCSSLTSVTIPNSVTSIGSCAFYGCSSLTSVTWNAKICNDINNSYFYEHPFYALTNLRSFTFGNEVERIPAYLCYRLTGLTSVAIPNSVTSIGNGAFSSCSNLNTVIIGENVTSIGEKAFKDCSLMENLVAVRERPIVIPSNTFEGVPTASCDLHVRDGSKIRYENQDVWKDFLIIVEDAEDWADVGGGGSSTGVYGDVNGDGQVTAADVTAVYNILLNF